MIVLSHRAAEYTTLRFRPDGGWLAAAQGSGFRWDVFGPTSGTLLGTVVTSGGVDSVAFDAESKLLFIDPTGHRLNVVTTSPSHADSYLSFPRAAAVFAVTVSGMTVVSYHFDEGTLARWAVASPSEPIWKRRVPGGRTWISSGRRIGILPDVSQVLTIESPETWGGAGELVVRSMKTGLQEQSIPFPGSRRTVFEVSPDGRFVAGSAETCETVYVWETADLSRRPVRLRSDGRKRITGVAFHPSGRWLAVTSNDATVKFYDTETWAVAKAYKWDVGRLRSVAFSPDGTLAAAGADAGKIVVWDIDA